MIQWDHRTGWAGWRWVYPGIKMSTSTQRQISQLSSTRPFDMA